MKAINQEELSKLSIQETLEGADELQLHKVDPAFTVKAVGYFYSAPLSVEQASITRREDDMVISGLDLHPTPAGLATIVPLSLAWGGLFRSYGKLVTNTSESDVIVAGGGKVLLAKEV